MEEFYLDGTLYYGRPQSAANRLDKEMACYDLLDRLEIPFARADHSPARHDRNVRSGGTGAGGKSL